MAALDLIWPKVEVKKQELAELIVNFPEKLGQVDIERIPALMILLSTIQAALAAHLAGSKNQLVDPSNEDRLIGIQEAALKIGVKEDWLYRHIENLPFVVRLGRSVRFSERGIEKFIRQRVGR